MHVSVDSPREVMLFINLASFCSEISSLMGDGGSSDVVLDTKAFDAVACDKVVEKPFKYRLDEQ